MSDLLVQELRQWANAPLKSPSVQNACSKAADEIERLRQEIEALKKPMDSRTE